MSHEATIRQRAYRVDVMVSSTSLDLPAHRTAAIDAIWRRGMHPLAMEAGTAASMDAVEFSLDMVDDADVYVGMFAFRYGHVPSGSGNVDGLSVTEMEFRRAVARKLPILIFMMRPSTLPEDVGSGPSVMETDPVKAEKLEALKRELQEHYVVKYFTTPQELGFAIYQALTDLVEQGRITLVPPSVEESLRPADKPLPEPPSPYIAHPYILTRQFVGRGTELKRLDEWAAADAPVMVVEAIGGMGKSALLWKWYQDSSSHAIPGLSGSIWWSFYESDATIPNFIRHALAYITRQPVASVDRIPREEREGLLLDALRGGAYLLVCDGLERTLAAYHRLDAAQLTDEHVGHAAGDLRKCTDPRDGEFLRSLVTCSPTKVLISTRLMPRELEDEDASSTMPGVAVLDLEGLQPIDALDLISSLGVRGDPAELKRFMAQFGNHPLILGVAAGRILNYRPAPCDFDIWFKRERHHLRLSDLTIDAEARRHSILRDALRGLDPSLSRFLSQVAAFRYPVEYEALKVLNPYMPADRAAERIRGQKAQAAEARFHSGLAELEDRGLLEWDRRSNRYDLHPIIRAFAFEQLKGRERSRTLDRIRGYFQGLPAEDLEAVHELTDLRRSLEIYYALVRAGRLQDAARFYGERLRDVLVDNVAAYATIVELLSELVPDEIDQRPALVEHVQEGERITDLAQAFYLLGQNSQALVLYELVLGVDVRRKRPGRLYTTLLRYAKSLRDDHQLAASLHARELGRDLAAAMANADTLADAYLNLLGMYREIGWWDDADEAYRQCIARPPAARTEFWLANVERYRAQILIYRGQDAAEALDRAWQLAQRSRNKLAQLQVHRYRAEAALQAGTPEEAAEQFQEAVALARASGDVILGVLLGGVARARVRQGRHDEARRLLDEAFAERNILDIFDLHNSAAEIYWALHERDRACEHALKAYQLSWCDGPPYAFWWDLHRARHLLNELGVEAPEMLAFDPLRVRPLAHEREISRLIAALQGHRTGVGKLLARLHPGTATSSQGGRS